MSERDAGVLYEASRNGYHLFLFGTFGWLLPSSRSRRTIALAMISCVLVSVMTEVLQFWVSSHTPEVSDAILNAAASTGAFWLRSRTASDATEA